MGKKKKKPATPKAEEPSLPKTLLDLPPELTLRIFKFLNHSEIAKIAPVCKTFNNISRDPDLYKNISVNRHSSREYLEWLLDRATNPKMIAVNSCRQMELIGDKLNSWRNMEELVIENVHLGCLLDGLYLKNILQFLRLKSCIIHHDAWARFLLNLFTYEAKTYELLNNICCCDECGLLKLMNIV